MPGPCQTPVPPRALTASVTESRCTTTGPTASRCDPMASREPCPRGAIAFRCALSMLAAILASVAIGAGCSSESRNRVLGFLFEDIPAEENAVPVPVVRSPRHPARPTPTPTPVEAQPSAASSANEFHTWDDVVRLLPKDTVGNPDWVAALEEKVIAPRAGIMPGAEDAEVQTLDVELIPESDPAFKVTFSHQKHGEWLACPNCHTSQFEMKAGTTAMTGAEAHGERYCGACHGKVAFDIASGCPLCHLRSFPKDSNGRIDWNRALADKLIAPRAGPNPKAADPPTLDLDVQMDSNAQPSVKSLFSHTTHTKWLACASCHPHPFPTNAKAADISAGDLHSRRYCGLCHGSVAFPIKTACERCHPALEKTRQHEAVLDLDVEVPQRSQPSSKGIFSHKTHRYVECANCHHTLFDTQAGATKMTMADLSGGKYCAGCHGSVAADLISQCQRCHADIEDAK